jgi:hypothetical protein
LDLEVIGDDERENKEVLKLVEDASKRYLTWHIYWIEGLAC